MTNNVRPKKHLGQHFLKDESIARKITQSIPENFNGNILEIGPGTGVLTKYLLDKSNFKVIEVDKESVEYLLKKYPNFEPNIIAGDFLQIDLRPLLNTKTCIIGNFPYNISSQIFFKVLENIDTVDVVVCMLQKEVAERLAASPRNKEYGILSVLLQTFYTIEYLFTVPPTVFIPPPKVNSGVIRLTRNNRQQLPCDFQLYKTVIKTAFNQRRKTMRNALKPLLTPDFSAEKYLNQRAEELTVEQFIELACAFKKP